MLQGWRRGPDGASWRAFEIENICDRPVRIQVINPGCGSRPNNEGWIQPGESVFVSASVMTHFDGPVSKQLRVKVIDLGEPIQ
ncbi:MAG TPA: hypothetical protein P5081_24735 [Phycisphaerae bacterium]|nr:hypothetical protein [Phycisphaerae bacterium]HRW56094.1 hypothetical protein [Phycisphaerae bacterium]